MQLNHITVILILNFLNVWCSKLDNRIIGGHPANIADYPFAARLALKRKQSIDFFCGATIIRLRWAITTAQCIQGHIDVKVVKAKEAYVFSNSTSYSKYTSKHRIVSFHSHEFFSKRFRNDNDIAVIKVKEPFRGVNEKLIQYAKSDYVYEDNTNATVLGWGATTPKGKFQSPDLRYVNLTLRNFQRCRSLLKGFRLFMTDRMICTAPTAYKAWCPGDSGGPLIQNNLLIGIVSHGLHCGMRAPQIYTRISKFSEWIKSKRCKKYRRNIRRSHISTRQF